MMVQLATLFSALLVAYFALGLLFGIAFVIAGAKKIDPVAQDGTWGFKLAILPAAAALWPWMLVRWIKQSSPPIEKNAHRRAAGCGSGCGCRGKSS